MKNLKSLSLEELRVLSRKIAEEEESRKPKFLDEYGRTSTRLAKMTADCGHFKENKCKGVHPMFDIGLPKPFALLLKLCPDCAQKATSESIMTDERWERMKKFLSENGENVPDRKTLKMWLEDVIPDDISKGAD